LKLQIFVGVLRIFIGLCYIKNVQPKEISVFSLKSGDRVPKQHQTSNTADRLSLMKRISYSMMEHNLSSAACMGRPRFDSVIANFNYRSVKLN
jgi:hypothetical protein